MTPAARHFLVISVAIVLGGIPISARVSCAQVDSCTDYATRDHWLPDPYGNNATPRKVASWNDRLIILRPDGLEIIGLDNPQVPAAAGRILGDFSDFAVGPDFVVLGSSGRLQGFGLPDLAPRFDYRDVSAAKPNVACRNSLVIASFGGHLELFNLTVSDSLSLVGSCNVPAVSDWEHSSWVGNLQIAGDHLLGCAGGGNNISGYYGVLTVVDIADVIAPVMTDQVRIAPCALSSQETMFFEAQPYGPGFVVSGLVITGDIRPEYTNSNLQFLARFRIEDGRIVWQGYVTQVGPMVSGFVIEGDTALWTVGLAYSGESGWSSLVNLDWGLANPVRSAADHHVRPGLMCWIHDRGTLISGGYMYHLENLRTCAYGGSYGDVSGYDYKSQMLDNRVSVSWSGWTTQTGPHDWESGFAIRTHDWSVSPARPISQLYLQPVGGCALMGRHIYFAVAGVSYRVDIATDGHLSNPVATNNGMIQCAIPWGEYYVVDTSDSLKVCSVNESGELTTISSVRHLWTGKDAMVRVDDMVLVWDQGYASGSIPYVYQYDLSDVRNPRQVWSSHGWRSFLKYVPEAGLLFDFGSGGLAWHRFDALGRPVAVGSWTTPYGGSIRDLQLHGDVLYLAMGSGGLGVFRFDPTAGLTPIGGDLGINNQVGLRPVCLVPSADGRLFLYPDLVATALDCQDPLPVFVSEFSARREPCGVRLTWRCNPNGAPSGNFEVERAGNGPDFVLGTLRVSMGDHELVDDTPDASRAHRYRLHLVDTMGRRTLLDEIEIVGAAPGGVGLVVTPNPFNASTVIHFELRRAGRVRLSIYDLAGRLQCTIVDEEQSLGPHDVAWDGRDTFGRDLSSGTYLARLEADGVVKVGRMGLVR